MPGRRGGSGGSGGPGSGGYRRPSEPAAVSPPGVASQRTDGVAPRVDLTGAEATSYGQRSELETMAGQTGGATGGPSGGGSGGGSTGGQPTGPPPELMDVYRPSDYPDMPSTPSSPFYDMAAQGVPDDPDVLLRAMYEVSRHPDILRMMSMRRGMV